LSFLPQKSLKGKKAVTMEETQFDEMDMDRKSYFATGKKL
jgi:hypothetical protein